MGNLLEESGVASAKNGSVEHNKVINYVYETMDYSMFKSLDGNRHINPLNVGRLKQSFKQNYLFTPIIINETGHVIDGQHRLIAAKELGLPVRYIIVPNYSINEVHILNTNMTNWKKLDYVHGYCARGFKEYIKLNNFIEEYPMFGVQICIGLLTNMREGASKKNDDCKGTMTGVPRKCYGTKLFEKGLFVVLDYELAVNNANKILEIAPFYDGYARSGFVNAMMSTFCIEDYVHSQFIKRIKANSTDMVHCAGVKQYRVLIEDIYNFRSKHKINLRY